MNEVKNLVGCLSKSIKKADQDLENIRFYSLGWPLEKQSTLAGYQREGAKKRHPQNYMKSRSRNPYGMSRISSNKQIRTPKISVFIVSGGQLKNSRHWQGYQRAGA